MPNTERETVLNPFHCSAQKDPAPFMEAGAENVRHDIPRAARTRKLIVIQWKYEVRNKNEEDVVIRTEGTYGMRNGKSCAELFSSSVLLQTGIVLN